MNNKEFTKKMAPILTTETGRKAAKKRLRQKAHKHNHDNAMKRLKALWPELAHLIAERQGEQITKKLWRNGYEQHVMGGWTLDGSEAIPTELALQRIREAKKPLSEEVIAEKLAASGWVKSEHDNVWKKVVELGSVAAKLYGTPRQAYKMQAKLDAQED